MDWAEAGADLINILLMNADTHMGVTIQLKRLSTLKHCIALFSPVGLHPDLLQGDIVNVTEYIKVQGGQHLHLI